MAGCDPQEREEDACVVIVTALPDGEAAERLADRRVSEGYVASVHVREMQTRYRWRGKIETGREQILGIYAPRHRMPDIEALIRSHHPYEMPPIHALTISSRRPTISAGSPRQDVSLEAKRSVKEQLRAIDTGGVAKLSGNTITASQNMVEI